MRSFAVIALAAAGANAAAYGYPAESSSAPAEYYPAASSTPAEYYPAESTPAYPAYPVESSKAAEYPAYPEESKYEAYSSAPAYTTTYAVHGLTTVCPEPTTVTYGSKTYTVSSSTTLIDEDCEYTTTEVVKPTPYPVHTPAHSEYAPPKYSSAAPYPSHPAGNGTVPVYPTGAVPKPSSTKPSTPEFTGAAGKASAGLLAVAGAAAAFFL